MTSNSPLLQKYGPWAVVTGASSGIGAEFSRHLAAAGMNVVLVARRVNRLEELAEEIQNKYSTQTKVLPADLAKPDGFKDVLAGTDGLDVGLLVNNAGMSSKGSFLRDELEYHQRLIAVNITSVMSLAYGFAKRFSSRGKSAILFVSSLLSLPAPYFAPYCSSKAFVTNLALTLRSELKKDGVDVSVLEPGIVKSEMSAEVLEQVDTSKLMMSMMETDECVRQAVAGLASGRSTIIPGFGNRMVRFMTGLMPGEMQVKMLESMTVKAMNPELLRHS